MGEKRKTFRIRLFINFNNWDSLQVIQANPQLDRSHSTSEAKQDLRTLLKSSKYWLKIHLPLGHHLSMEGIQEDYWAQQTSGDEAEALEHFLRNCKSRFLNAQYSQAAREVPSRSGDDAVGCL